MSMVVSWSLDSNGGNSPVVYNVLASDVDSNCLTTQPFSTNDTSGNETVIIDLLSPNTEYSVHVIAVTSRPISGGDGNEYLNDTLSGASTTLSKYHILS